MIDEMTAVRDWLRSKPIVTASVGASAIDVGLINGQHDKISITRIGGGDLIGEAPLDQPLIQFDIVGTRGGYARCVAAKNAVQMCLHELNNQPVAGVNGWLYGAQIASVLWSPDPDDDRPRFVITASFVTRQHEFV